MNPHLQKQQEAFKSTLLRQNQPPPAAVPPRPSPINTNSAGLTTIGGRPINSYVHSIISYLKSVEKPVSFEELHRYIGVDLSTCPPLLDKVRLNERISFDGTNLCYKPVFSIRSKDDIIRILSSRPDMAGLDISELREAYPKIEEACFELTRDGQIFTIRPREDGPKIIFTNDIGAQTPMEATFKSLWNSIKLPADDEELRQAIRKAGMLVSSRDPHLDRVASSNQKSTTNSLASSRKKSAKRSFRRIKITNDYLEGIDLSIDPQDMPK